MLLGAGDIQALWLGSSTDEELHDLGYTKFDVWCVRMHAATIRNQIIAEMWEGSDQNGAG